MKSIFSFSAIVATSFCITLASHAQPTGKPVRIIATGIHHGGSVIYKYQVSNTGDKPIARIMLGMAENEPNFRDQLNLFPNWGTQTVGKVWFSPASVTQPQGWGSSLANYADDGGGPGIDWIEGSFYRRIFPRDQMENPNVPTVFPRGRMIGPGQSSDAFSVKLSRPDYAYVKTMAIVDYGDDSIAVTVEKGDITPPTLEMNVSLSKRNGTVDGMTILHVQGRATDNLDPEPDLVLLPVIANEPLEAGAATVEGGRRHWRVQLKNVPGRLYQIRLVATDASGNSTEKSFTYDVSNPVK